MSDHKDTKQNKDELAQVRSLIGDAEDGDFSLDDILAEYGSQKKTGRGAVPLRPHSSDLPWPAAKHPPEKDNVVPFPGTDEDSDEALEDEDTLLEEDELDEQDESPNFEEDDSCEDETAQPKEKILSFPEEESALTAFLKDLGRKADNYADQMFSESEQIDPEEVRRLEELIPGTDQEDVPDEDEDDEPPVYHRPKRKSPPPPDYTPQELLKRYGKKLDGMRLRTRVVFVLAILSLFQLLVPALDFEWLPPLNSPAIQCAGAVGLLVLGVLLGMDVLIHGIARALRLRVGMDSLAALSCLFTIVDGVLLLLKPEGPDRLPYSAVALVGLYFLLSGSYHRRAAVRLSCRAAAATSSPYRVTLDEGMWNGLDTYTKWSGDTEGFGSQIQSDDGAQLIFSRVCPIFLVADVVLALLNSVFTQRPEQLFWCLSALFTATAAFGGALAYGRPFHLVAKRLAKNGAVLAGWPGIANSRRGNRVLITDSDLFPIGTVQLNGYKIASQFTPQKVLSYAASLIDASDSGLSHPFYDELRRTGGLLRKVEGLCFYEGGGLSANIRGDEVLVGSADFMKLMDVELPQGLSFKSAAFCAINGELAGIFALIYKLPPAVFPALEELIEEKIGPVLATRDFNLIPATLTQMCHLAADKLDFPQVERRWELSDPEQDHSEVLTALLSREGLFPFAETIAGAKRLRWATRLGAILCCIGSALGLVLAAYLTSVSAFTSLSPLNLLVFMLIWLAPVWFLSGWVHRY